MTEIREPSTSYREIANEWKEWCLSLVRGWQIWLVVALMQALVLAADLSIPEEQSQRTIHIALLVYSAYKVHSNW